MRRGGMFSLVWFWIVAAFLYLPLVLLVVLSFNASRTLHWGGMSLRWYRELFLNSRALWASFGNSAIIALSSATLATTLGTAGAIGMHRFRFRFRGIIQTFSFFPLILPEIIIGVSLLLFFAGIHLRLGLFSIFIAHTTFNTPFVLLIVMARLEEFDQSIIEAAYDLGAGEWTALWKVLIPVALPGIFAGFLMAVTLSLEDFVITFFVAGPGSSTLPLHVYSMIRFGVSPVINALSALIIAGTVVLALSMKGVSRYIIGNRSEP
jgi:spermidine/putrescine transport system permease protein